MHNSNMYPYHFKYTFQPLSVPNISAALLPQEFMFNSYHLFTEIQKQRT